MKPHRIRMTHNLLLNYGLYRKMEIYVSLFQKIHTFTGEGSRAKSRGWRQDRSSLFLVGQKRILLAKNNTEDGEII